MIYSSLNIRIIVVRTPLRQFKIAMAYVGDTGKVISVMNSKINNLSMPFPKF